jgi:hypothetical protein
VGIREVIEDSITPIFAHLEEDIHRQGPVRFLIGAVLATLGLFAAVSPFGVEPALWSVGGLLVFLTLVVALSASSGTKNLREREQELTRQLANFGSVLEGLQLNTGLVFEGQEDEVVISKNGDMKHTRTLRLGASSPEIPHYARSGFTADTTMSRYGERRVKVVATYARNSDRGVRILLTTSWDLSTENTRMLVAHAYIGDEVKAGDRVKFEIDWPKACRRLRKKEDSESFTMRFKNRAFPLQFSVILEDCATPPAINYVGNVDVENQRDGKNWKIWYTVDDAKVGDRVGFSLDLR